MNDMERIQRGLEEFLRQQMQEETEEKEIEEKEIDIISTGRQNSRGSQNAGRSRSRSHSDEYKEYDDIYEEYGDGYEEDWDTKGRSANSRPAKRRSQQGMTSREEARGGGGNRGKEERPRGGQKAGQKTGQRTGQKAEQKGYQKEEQKERKKRRTKKKKSGLKVFLVRVAMLLFFLAAGLYFLVAAAYSKLNYHEIESVASEPMREDGVINILLIGNDSRENGEDGRSDAMILLSVSPKNKRIYMTSLLRDMYVEIPGHDNNRLNAAYSYGGAELLMKTVEENLDIEVNRYMLVNFEAFANLVDAVGGVDLELFSAEIEWVNAYLNEYNLLTGKEFGTDYMDTSQEGLVHLNGPQALAYTRNRYIGTDFGRTERQRKVLKEVVRSLPKGMLHPIKLMDGLMPNLTTNLTRWECYQLALMAPLMLTYDMEQGSIPVEGTYRNATIRKMAVLEVDFEANKEYLHKLLFEAPQKEEAVEEDAE